MYRNVVGYRCQEPTVSSCDLRESKPGKHRVRMVECRNSGRYKRVGIA